MTSFFWKWWLPVIPVPCSVPHQKKSSEDLDVLHLKHVVKSQRNPCVPAGSLPEHPPFLILIARLCIKTDLGTQQVLNVMERGQDGEQACPSWSSFKACCRERLIACERASGGSHPTSCLSVSTRVFRLGK